MLPLRLAASRTVLTGPIRIAALSTTSRAMAEGDVGAPPKAGGQGDAFQRRERASEDMAIRKREQEKLLELKRRLHEQQQHLARLSKHIDEITKEQGGGEQN
ncbi:hypothetical protein L249_6982 [Ophiocordyceps polyrhachis-furcata BCC 54312]|uniref:ATPase inhibitor, mitochondrial n=1 Tax=Ophiocordyceps polyrhachis-furcata BCC 54312 TaxID=1330021 RepID=A0A367LLX6_9HYPO|nr:hypothetical protein L249_6982 [Ophiocordyceps polyrhachis-furcata BCC 54312]